MAASPVLDSRSVSSRTKTARALTSARADWLAERRTYLGATDVAAILGLNPYSSAHDVWLAKTNGTEKESTLAMRAGIVFEAFIAEEFRAIHSTKIRKSRLYRHESFPFLACNPDREITYRGVDALLECKKVGHWAAKNFGQDASDQVPAHYMVQIMWQLLITRRPLVVLAAVIDDRELRTYCYSFDPQYSDFAHVFDPEVGKRTFNRAIQWWNRHIVGGIEPELDGSDCDTEWVKSERDTYENGRMTNTDQATDRECVRLEKARIRRDRAERVVNERQNRIKAFMAQRGASSLESSCGLFTWKTNARGVATFLTPFKTNKA